MGVLLAIVFLFPAVLSRLFNSALDLWFRLLR